MSKYARTVALLTLLSCLFMAQQPVSGRILKKCDAASELRRSKVIDKSFIAHLVCVMQYDGKYNTSLITGPGTQASYSYGVFQISSNKWCSRFRPGGECKKKCDDFANDDIQDDIVCANMIFEKEGLKHWPGWVKNCKKNVPSLTECKSRAGGDDEPDSFEDAIDYMLDESEEIEKEEAALEKILSALVGGKKRVEEVADLKQNVEELTMPREMLAEEDEYESYADLKPEELL